MPDWGLLLGVSRSSGLNHERHPEDSNLARLPALDLGLIEAARRLVPEVEQYRFEMMVHQSVHRRGRFHDKSPR